MNVREDLEQAIARVDEVLAEALRFFRHAPDGSAAPGGPWGPKEVLAHIVWWHTFSCESVEGVLAGRDPQPPQGVVDAINAQAAAAHAATPIAALADRLEAVHQRMVAAMRALPDPSAIVMRRPDGSAFNAPQRLQIVANHVRGHLDELRRGTP